MSDATILHISGRCLDAGKRRRSTRTGIIPPTLFLSAIQGRKTAETLRWSRREDGASDAVPTRPVRLAEVHIRRRPGWCELRDFSKRGCRTGKRVNPCGRGACLGAVARDAVLHLRQRSESSEFQSRLLLQESRLDAVRDHEKPEAADPREASLTSPNSTNRKDQNNG